MSKFSSCVLAGCEAGCTEGHRRSYRRQTVGWFSTIRPPLGSGSYGCGLSGRPVLTDAARAAILRCGELSQRRRKIFFTRIRLWTYDPWAGDRVTESKEGI